MLKTIRVGKSNLSREILNDIFATFDTDYRDFKQNQYRIYSEGTVWFDEACKSFDSMSYELLKSFQEVSLKETVSVNNFHNYVSQSRINQLCDIKSNNFDISKLIRLCEELNIAYKNEAYYSVGFLVRIIKDHIPLIFGKNSFAEVAAGVGNSSPKKSLQNLEISLKNIADDMAHGHISRKEILPNSQRVSFQADLDVLLGLVIKELS